MSDLFALNLSPFELIVRASVMYWFIFLMFRFVLRRDAGGVGIADILLVVLVADTAQNGMAGAYTTLPEGLIAVGTLMAWNLLIDWASFRSEALRKLLEPAPLLLIDGGHYLYRNLRKEFVSKDELEGELRKRGIASVSEVRRAYMESDGSFSVIPLVGGPPSEKRELPGH